MGSATAMHEYRVEILGLTGSYPGTPVRTRLCAYDIVCGIPLFITAKSPTHGQSVGIQSDADLTFAPAIELLRVAMWLCFPDFPRFVFDEHPPDSILVQSPRQLRWGTVAAIVRRVFSDSAGDLTVRNSTNGYGEQTQNGGVSIVSLAGQTPSTEVFVQIWSHDDRQTGAVIASEARAHALFRRDIHVPTNLAKRLFGLLSTSPRLVQVAAHYYGRACMLVDQGFVEEAGLSLYLVYETIMKDFELLNGMRGKKQSLKKLKRAVRLPAGYYPWLDELWEARRRFLAHPDYWMFTENQRINDPDGYCYDHFIALSLLLMKYARYRRRHPGQIVLPDPYD